MTFFVPKVIIGKEYASHFGYGSPLDVISQHIKELKPGYEYVVNCVINSVSSIA